MTSDSLLARQRERMVRSVCAELERRLRAGEGQALESIFAAHPDLAQHEDSAIELLYAEFIAREEMGQAPAAAELVQRFPQWQQRLSRLLQVHEALRPEPDEEETPRETHNKQRTTLTARDGTSADSAPKHRLGQYEILGEIARGGMGVIYRAKQHGLNRIVALKVIRSSAATESERARFRLEAEATARLQHPHIVPIYEVGEQDGCDYLSMEYVEGGNLDQYLATRTVTAHYAAELLLILSEAMQFAHERGVVHRDLKPGNVLLATNGVPKIADFGLAKRLFEGGVGQTETGAILGTPCYMAPEQAEGKTSAIGPRTDVYALGAMLYQMLTGRPPFEAETPMATLDQIRTQEALPPSRWNAKVPRDLETICLTCLQHEPDRRYASAQALADDLRRFIEHEPILARPTRIWERLWRKARRRPLTAGLCGTLLLVLAFAAAIVQWQQRRVGELATVNETTRRDAQQSQQRASKAEANAESSFRKAHELVDRWTRLGEELMHQPGMGEISEQALEESLKHYEAFLSQRSDDPQMTLATARACERAGIIQIELGRFEKAEQSLLRGVELYKTLEGIAKDESSRRRSLAGVLGQLGNARRRLEKWAPAEQSYRDSIELLTALLNEKPTNNEVAFGLSNVWVNLAQVFRQGDRVSEAEDAYMQAIRLQRSSICRRGGDCDAASRDALEKANSLPAENASPAHIEIVRSQTVRRVIVEEFQRVLPVVAKENLLFELALSLDDFGSLLNRQSRREDAEAATREGLELRLLTRKFVNKSPWCDSYLARSYEHVASMQSQYGDYQGAESGYRQALQLIEPLVADYPERLDYSRSLSSLHAQLAECFGLESQFDESKKYFAMAIAEQEKLLAKNPSIRNLERNLGETLLSRASVLQRAGEYAAALENLNRATQISKDSARAWNNRAWFLVSVKAQEFRDPEKAVEYARKAVELAPKRSSGWNTLGAALYRSGKFDDALAALSKSVELGKGVVEDWYFLSMVHAKLGQNEQAQQYFDKAQQWMQTNKPNDEALNLIAAESSEVLTSPNP